MKEEINFRKTVKNKIAFEKVLDTSFKEFGVQSTNETIEEQPTVNNFFEMYNDIFKDIPEEGVVNSHEFLIKKSSEYIDFEENNEIIEALQKEIAELRTELLDTQKQLISSQTGINIDDPTTNGVMTNINSNTTSNTGVGSTSNSSGGGY